LQAFSSTDGAVDTGNSLVSKAELSILIRPCLSTDFPRARKNILFFPKVLFNIPLTDFP